MRKDDAAGVKKYAAGALLLALVWLLNPWKTAQRPRNAAEETPLPAGKSVVCPREAENGAETAQSKAGNYIALTFDDGPHRGTTDRLLDGLLERNAKATFFLVGEEAAGNRDLVIRMGAEGHQIGNHTWSHCHLDEVPPEAAAQEIGKTDALLQSLLGPGEYWLRPPYGLLRPGMEKEIPVPIVRWSVDPRDWESRNTEKVIRAVLDAAEPGSVVLLHDIYATSVEAALYLIDRLREKGCEFVTVKELLERSGVTPRPGMVFPS